MKRLLIAVRWTSLTEGQGHGSTRRVAYRFALLVTGSLIAIVPAIAESSSRWFQVVSPGESIQAAIDRAMDGGLVLVRPGTYRETADPTNGLTITRSVHVVGLSARGKKVVLENSGGQRNGIVAVPAAHTDCMSCHSTMAPPFDLLPGVDSSPSPEPGISGLSIRGLTIKDFTNNGLFTRNVERFAIADVHSVGNKNYGIFPTASRNGLITHSSATGADDSGFWVETSERIVVTHNRAERNVIGFEVSNSDDVLLAHNKATGNSLGMAIMFLPSFFGERPDIQRIRIQHNLIRSNNKTNTAPPGSVLSLVPSGMGIFHLGADESLITKNVIKDHDFVGIGIVDYCLALAGTPFECPALPPEFVADSAASNNRVIRNRLENNGRNPDPSNPFAFAAGDIGLLTLEDNGNCFEANALTAFFSTLGFLPSCP